MFLAFILEKSIFNITWFTLSENKFALVGNLLSVALIQLVNSLWVIGLREFWNFFCQAGIKTQLLCLSKGLTATVNSYMYWHYASYHLSTGSYDKAAFISQIVSQTMTYLINEEQDPISLFIPLSILSLGLFSGGYTFRVNQLQDLNYLWYLTVPRLSSSLSNILYARYGDKLFHTSLLISLYTCVCACGIGLYEYLKVSPSNVEVSDPSRREVVEKEKGNFSYLNWKFIGPTLMVCILKSDLRFFSNWCMKTYNTNTELLVDRTSGFLYKAFLKRSFKTVRAVGYEGVALASKEFYNLYHSLPKYSTMKSYTGIAVLGTLLVGSLTLLSSINGSGSNIFLWIRAILFMQG